MHWIDYTTLLTVLDRAASPKTMLYRTTFHDGDHSNSQDLQTTEAASSVAMSDV